MNNSNFTDILHPSLEIACQDGFEVYSIPNRIQITFEKNETAGFRPSEHGIEVWKNGELISVSMFRWHIKSKGKSPLYVKTIYRNQSDQAKGTPYKGVLEVARSKDMLTLVNEIGLEEYLYSVVPSEMPVRFGLEALKVQAVAARAYAARAILASKYRAYGAHLDDSTSSQVYNNISEQDISTHAVNDTAGIVPVYEDQIVDTRFSQLPAATLPISMKFGAMRITSFLQIKFPILQLIRNIRAICRICIKRRTSEHF